MKIKLGDKLFWAAVLTWLSGAAALMKMGILADAFMLKEGAAVIGMGAWLGTIMLFNVWVLIWPNQQKILAMKEASAIPMLLGMTAHAHGLPF